MEITPTAIKSLKTSFLSIFRKGYDGTEPFYAKLCTEVPSSASQNDYGWMAKLPKMREWLGERIVQNLLTQSYAIKNKRFELTVGVDRDDIEDDNLGVYNPIVQEVGIQTQKQPDDLVVSLLQNGHTATALCYDGQSFFDTDHPVNPKDTSLGTQQNYWSSGKALNKANLVAVRAAMMTFKGEDNRPLGVNPRLLIVPPALEDTARQLAYADIIREDGTGSAGVTNTLKGMYDVLVIPELAGQDTTWYLADVSRAIKGLVFQKRRAASFTMKTDVNDENVFHQNLFLFGADARNNAGYALWFLMAKAVA